jgi:hypothetical protein
MESGRLGGNPMSRRVILAVAAVLAVGAIAGGAVAFATGNDSEGGATGPKADRASEAALDATNGGTVNAIELDNENGATWEVEVTTTDGSTVDVYLDDNYDLITIEGDSEVEDSDNENEG